MTMSNQILWLMAMLLASANAEAFIGHGDGHGHVHGHGHGHSDSGLDPHKNICWDVSVYKEVEFLSKPCQKCYPRLTKNRYDHHSKVCQDVTELKCDIVGYTNCKVEMVPKKYRSQESGYNYFQTHSCTKHNITVQHNKTRPVCHNVNKQNCVTKWEMLPNGTKVWSGNKDCKPVSWEECHEEIYEAPFEKDIVTCKPDIKIPYCNGCKPVYKDIMTVNYVCEPKSSLECKSHTYQKCIDVHWQDIVQEVVDDCVDDMVWQPFQNKSHEKRCLLDPGVDGRVPYAPPHGPTPTKPPVYHPPSTTYTTQPPPTYHTQPPVVSGYGVPQAKPLGPSGFYGVPDLVVHG